MAITIKDITELPPGTPVNGSPIIYGNGTNLFTTTLGYILSQVDQGITDLSYQVIESDVFYAVGSSSNPLADVDATINAGQISFITFEVQSLSGVLTLNTYLIPLGEGVYQPLSSSITFDDLILIDKQEVGGNPSGSNTVTYVATNLTAINASSPALDLTDTTKVYFIDLDDGFYRFIGTNGLYGSGELQMVQGDLESIEQPVEFPQLTTATPPVSGTFEVALNNTDYSGTVTSLTNIDIASGAFLGGFARVKGNWATEPTVTGATQANNSGFTANVDLYLYFEKWADGVVYWYDLN